MFPICTKKPFPAIHVCQPELTFASQSTIAHSIMLISDIEIINVLVSTRSKLFKEDKHKRYTCS